MKIYNHSFVIWSIENKIEHHLRIKKMATLDEMTEYTKMFFPTTAI